MKAAGCIIVEDAKGQVFLTRRSMNTAIFKHAWVFPGGHLEVGESLEEGALRELEEEAGISIVHVNNPDGTSAYLFQRKVC